MQKYKNVPVKKMPFVSNQKIFLQYFGRVSQETADCELYLFKTLY